MSAVELDTVLVKERGVVRLWLPPELAGRIGDERLVPAVVTINGTPVHTTLHKRGGGYLMVVSKALRTQLGVTDGDSVHVLVERAAEERTATVPADLADALASAGARDAFDRLTPFRRNELVTSVESARRSDTRTRRIERVVHELTSPAS